VKHDKANIYPMVRELWEEKLTTSEIGRRLGLTKNAICGLIYRMRKEGILPSPSKNTSAAGKPQQPVGGKVVPMKPRKKKTAKTITPLPLFAAIEPPPPPPPPPPPKVPSVQRDGIPFIDLRNNSCRYVVSGKRAEDFRFCGDPRTTTAYCADHAALCYVPFSRSPQRKPLYKLTGRNNGP